MSCITHRTGSVETRTLVADVINVKEGSPALAKGHMFSFSYSRPIQETGDPRIFF